MQSKWYLCVHLSRDTLFVSLSTSEHIAHWVASSSAPAILDIAPFNFVPPPAQVTMNTESWGDHCKYHSPCPWWCSSGCRQSPKCEGSLCLHATVTPGYVALLDAQLARHTPLPVELWRVITRHWNPATWRCGRAVHHIIKPYLQKPPRWQQLQGNEKGTRSFVKSFLRKAEALDSDQCERELLLEQLGLSTSIELAMRGENGDVDEHYRLVQSVLRLCATMPTTDEVPRVHHWPTKSEPQASTPCCANWLVVLYTCSAYNPLTPRMFS